MQTLQLKMQIEMIETKKNIFKNYAAFTNCISRINNTQVNGAQNIDVVMPMYNVIQNSDNDSKIYGILWQYCRDETAINVANGNIVDFDAANATTNSFKIKEKMTGKTGNNGTNNVEIIVPLNNGTIRSSVWRTLQMPLINGEINLDLNWSKKCIIVATAVANQGATFSKIDTKPYVPVLTLST